MVIRGPHELTVGEGLEVSRAAADAVAVAVQVVDARTDDG
jgi:hypothetical protein